MFAQHEAVAARLAEGRGAVEHGVRERELAALDGGTESAGAHRRRVVGPQAAAAQREVVEHRPSGAELETPAGVADLGEGDLGGSRPQS